MELLYLTDVSQIHYTLDTAPDLFRNLTPVTGDLVVCNELEKLGINFINEWDYLPPARIESNWVLSTKLTKYWWDELGIDLIKFKNISLYQYAGQDLAWSFETALNARVAYEKIFDAYKIERIAGYFLPNIAVVRTGPFPTHRAVRSVSQSVLFWLANSKNIPIERIKSTYELSAGITSKKLTVESSDRSSSIKKKHIKKVVLVFSDGLSKDEYNAIKSAYSALEDWEIIAVTKDNINYSMGDIEIGESLSSTFQAFLTASENYTGKYPEIFGNSYLNFQFQGIWTEMEKAFLLSNTYSAFLDIIKPAVVIFGHEAFTIESVFVELAKLKKISTVSLFHGGLGPKFGFMGLVGKSDHILVWNRWDKEILQSYGIDPSRINIIGSVRYEQKFRRARLNERSFSSKQSKKMLQSLGLNSQKPVVLLLTAAINCGFAAPVSDPNQHRKAWRDIREFIRKRNDLQFIIKPHPSFDYYELYKNLITDELPNLFFFETLTFDEVIEVGTISILINYFTTAALDSLINKTPVIFFQNATYPLSDWKNSISELDIIEVNSISSLESSVDDILNSLNTAKGTYVNDNVIAEFVGISEKAASKRLVEFIDQLVIGYNDTELIKQLKDNPVQFFENQLENFSMLYSRKEILFVISYILGTFKIGIHSLFNLKTLTFDSKFIIPYEEKIRFLTMSYIYSSRTNSISNDWKSAIFLFGSYLINPRRYLSLSPNEKAKIKEFILLNILMNDYLIVTVKRIYVRLQKNRGKSYK